MATTYPTTKQSIPNPSSTDLMENATPELDHDYQHSTVNDTIEALQDKVGIDGSAVTTSHDYKLGEVTGSDKAVGKTATQTLTNKTLTSPQVNFGSDARGDMIYRNGSGTTTRLPIGTNGQILSTNSSGDPEWVANPAAADASTTVKGVVEEATLAETLARTTSGGTSARLFVNPSTLTTVQTYDYAADSVGTDAYAITVTPAPTAYVTGQVFRFKAGTANTGASTLNVNSLGAISIKKNYNSDTATGDIKANQIVEVVYDGTNFQMQSPASGGIQTYSFGVAQGSASPQTIAHGLGVTPKFIKITAYASPATGTTTVTSTGTYDGTTNRSVYWSGNTGSVGTDTTYIIKLERNTSGSDYVRGAATFDSTNITITWTVNVSASSAAYFHWEAFA